MQSRRAGVALILLALLFGGCGGGGGGITQTAQLQVLLERNPLEVNSTASMEVRLVRADGTPLTEADYEIINPAPLVVSVSPAGGGYVVRGLSQGTARIRVRERRTGLEREIEVSVVQTPPTVARIEVIAERTVFLIGERTTFRAMAYDDNGNPMEVPVRWFSSNTVVMGINTSGVAEARAEGRATITARWRDGDISGSVEVEVRSNLPGSGNVGVIVE
ncbi:MAG: Ig-like domain-containing protein [Fimbriimonadales bacterium]|nr:Ig-like domain-containing protein [Armatimonadota bacterium]MCX7687926.1 Ig-like domain-containing protein [Fimbriimonadales bacterium]